MLSVTGIGIIVVSGLTAEYVDKRVERETGLFVMCFTAVSIAAVSLKLIEFLPNSFVQVDFLTPIFSGIAAASFAALGIGLLCVPVGILAFVADEDIVGFHEKGGAAEITA